VGHSEAVRVGRFGSAVGGLVLALLVPPAAAGPVRADRADRVDRVAGALRILHGWDAARASAYVRDDPAGLRALYLPGSTAAEADVRLLRRYAERRARIGWLATQVFAVRVVQRTPTSVRLRVVDRVVGAATTPARCVRLPVEPPAARVVDLRWDGARWRMAAVRAR
jgi:hypothetical protein